MEAANLYTAATYVNNLLLARGLLRNGKSVEFAQLASLVPKEKRKEAEGNAFSATNTVADIINLVHDLILKRDRDQEHQESLTYTLRSLRTDATRNTSEIEKLKERNKDFRRQVASYEGAQRAAETAAKNAEASARTLREEVSKVKVTLAQVRSQCSNDIRKRDVQIQNLKKHLSDRQRGNRTGVTGPSIMIRPGLTGMATSANGGFEEDTPNLEDEQYSLRQETTEFLTQLSQNLSDENDSLIRLIRNTSSTLKDLQGLPHNQPNMQQDSRSGIGSRHGFNDGEQLVQVNDVSFETLSSDLQRTLDSLTDLLTNPSFAPIEEVHVREEEIRRLREGWEKMESRWHEAIVMMQGWRKRMLTGGGNVKLDELKMGLCLGEGLDSPSQKPHDSSKTENAVEPREEEISEDISDEDQPSGNGAKDLPPIDDSFSVDNEPLFDNHSMEEEKASKSHSIFEDTVLRETNGNRPPQPPPHGKPASTEISIENSSPIPHRPRSKAMPHTASHTRQTNSRLPSRKVHLSSSRVKHQSRSSPALEPDLSVNEKLQIAEREARRASSGPANKTEGSGSGQCKDTVDKSASQISQVGSLRVVDRSKLGLSPAKKRSKITGRPRRRKSTLSPEELEGLMMTRA